MAQAVNKNLKSKIKLKIVFALKRYIMKEQQGGWSQRSAYSQPWQQIEVNDQIQASVALFPEQEYSALCRLDKNLSRSQTGFLGKQKQVRI